LITFNRCPRRSCSSCVRPSDCRKLARSLSHSSKRQATSALLISSGLSVQEPSKMCSNRMTHSRIALTCSSASRFSAYRLTIALSRLSRFWHVWLTAAPFFPASPGCCESDSRRLASPVPHIQMGQCYQDLTLLPRWLHTPPARRVVWPPALVLEADADADLDDTRASSAACGCACPS